MKPAWRQRCLAALCPVAAWSLAGCYTFASVQGTPPVGSDVRAVMTDEEALSVSRQTGQLSRSIDGRLTGATDDSVVVSVVTYRAGSEISGTRQLRQSVVIDRDGIQAFQARELSAWRSGLAGVLAASAVYLVVDRVVTGGSSDDDTDPDDPITTLIPILRIPIGR